MGMFKNMGFIQVGIEPIGENMYNERCLQMVPLTKAERGNENMRERNTKLSKTILAVVCAMSALTVLAHGFVGSWNGQLDLCVTKLRIVINVSVDASCTFASPGQSATEIPAKFKTTKVDKPPSLSH